MARVERVQLQYTRSWFMLPSSHPKTGCQGKAITLPVGAVAGAVERPIQ